ncbi:MAG: hypothetical protein K0R48_977 [Gammaproteobacteria bacterium]|nr:hypothetical protein [Gammaproteobacteria bacterium]
MAATNPFDTKLSSFTLQEAIHPHLYRDAIATVYKEPNARAVFYQLNRLYGLIAHYIATGHLGSKEKLYSDRKYREHVYTLLPVRMSVQIADFGSRYIEFQASEIYQLLETCATYLNDYTEENARILNEYLIKIQILANEGRQLHEVYAFYSGKDAEEAGMIYQHIKNSAFNIQQELRIHYPKLSISNQLASSSSAGIQTKVEPSQLKPISTELPQPADSVVSKDDIEACIQKTEQALKKCETTSGEEYNTTLDSAKQYYTQAIRFLEKLPKEAQEKYQGKLDSILSQLKPRLEEKFYEKEEKRREGERHRRNQLQYEAEISRHSENIAGAIQLLASRDKDARNYYATALYPQFLKQAQEGKDVLCYLTAYKNLAVIALRYNSEDLERPRTYVEYARSFLKYIKDKDTKDFWEELLNRLLPTPMDLQGDAPVPADPAISALHSAGMLKAPSSSSHTNKPLPTFSRTTLGSKP